MLDPRQQQAQQNQNLTAQQIAQAQELQSMLQKGGQNTSNTPFTSPWQSVAQVAQSLAGRNAAQNLNQQYATFNAAGAPGQPATPDQTNGSTDQTTGAPSPRAQAFSPDVASAIVNGSRTVGVDPNFMATVAHIESDGKPDAKTGSYKGLFQLSDQDMRDASGGKGNVYNPLDNTMAAGILFKRNAAQFEQQAGREPNVFDLYMTHQQGVGGYLAHVYNANGLAWQNMLNTEEGQAKGPQWAKEAITGNGGNINDTSGQFLDRWHNKWLRMAGGDHGAFAADSGAAAPGAGSALGFAPGGAPGGPLAGPVNNPVVPPPAARGAVPLPTPRPGNMAQPVAGDFANMAPAQPGPNFPVPGAPGQAAAPAATGIGRLLGLSDVSGFRRPGMAPSMTTGPVPPPAPVAQPRPAAANAYDYDPNTGLPLPGTQAAQNVPGGSVSGALGALRRGLLPPTEAPLPPGAAPPSPSANAPVLAGMVGGGGPAAAPAASSTMQEHGTFMPPDKLPKQLPAPYTEEQIQTAVRMGRIAPQDAVGYYQAITAAKQPMSVELPHGTITYNPQNPSDQVFWPKIQTQMIPIQLGGRLLGGSISVPYTYYVDSRGKPHAVGPEMGDLIKSYVGLGGEK